MIDLLAKQRYFFIGVAGAGMSAIAQYLAGNGKTVSGSDRLFLAESDDPVQKKLEEAHIQCFIQDGSGLDPQIDYVIVSTAIEETNPEIQKARLLNIPVVLRADLLAAICKSKRTIAIAGTSGKSSVTAMSVTAMLYHILEQQGLGPSLISGAGLVDLQRKGKIGNAACGDGEWLLIEADESDGTLVKYEPEIGLLLSIDKDHKEISELMDIFTLFRSHCSQHFIVNRSHPLASSLTTQSDFDFGKGTLYEGHDFVQEGFSIQFRVAGILVSLPAIGLHSMENALACMAVAGLLGVSIQACADALAGYQGIYRRHQYYGTQNDIILVDDYAHNPAKIAASIRACTISSQTDCLVSTTWLWTNPFYQKGTGE